MTKDVIKLRTLRGELFMHYPSALYFFLRFYLFILERHTGERERERERARQRHRQREKQAPYRELDLGLDSGSPGSRPGLKVS